MNEKYFCMAPFRKMLENPNGRLRTCCHYTDLKKSHVDIREAFYGEEMDLHRQQMINGEKLEGCKICHMHEKSPGHKRFRSQRMHYNNEYNADYYIKNNIIPEAYITDLELSIDNTCNYMCITCTPRASSAWVNRIGDSIGPTGFRLNNLGNRSFTNSLKKPTSFEIEKYLPTLKHLILSGGEPTIQKKFDNEFFEKILKTVDDDFGFGMITNGSRFINESGEKLIKKLKKVLIMFSLDGVDQFGEWCRYGMKMRIIRKNLNRWIELLKDKEDFFYENMNRSGLIINICVHNYNIFNIYNTLEFIENLGLNEYQYILSYNNSNTNTICPSKLPFMLKDMILEKMIFFNKGHEDFTHHLLTMDSYDEEYCLKFVKYTDYLLEHTKYPPEECLYIYQNLKEIHGW